MNKHGGYLGDQKNILDFSININPLGMPKLLRKRLETALDKLHKYPEITGETPRKKIAQDIAVPPENIILGNGAIELIYLFAKALKPKTARIITPTFNEYKRALLVNGCKEIKEFVLTKEKGFDFTSADLQKELEHCKPEVIYLCNPTNPTGKLYTKAFIAELMEKLPKETIWFIDESFIEFSGAQTCLDFVKDTDHRIFLLRSLTKFFGVPGLRIGYGVGSEPLISAMEAYKEPWTINTLALEAAMCVYDDQAYIEETRQFIKTERDRVYKAFLEIPHLTVYPSGADFHLIQVEGMTAKQLQERLLKKGINIRTCEDFVGLEQQFFRVAVKKRSDNDLLIKYLNQILRG